MDESLDRKNLVVMKLLHYFITEKGYNPVVITKDRTISETKVSEVAMEDAIDKVFDSVVCIEVLNNNKEAITILDAGRVNEDTKKIGTLYYGRHNQIGLPDPEDLGKELFLFFSSGQKPEELLIADRNSLTKWINTL